ncbi:MAG: hypothetical protein KDN22_08980 [Verrucomicrobiae bacterium]|nr:hypothetical protein [Verrucomicrobiae bacterium]
MMELISKVAAIVGLMSALSVGGIAGEKKVPAKPIEVSMAMVEIPLSDEIQFGMDALRSVHPEAATGGGIGIIKGEISEILERLLKVKGSILVSKGTASTENETGEAVFTAGKGKVGKHGLKSGERSRVSVHPVIDSSGNTTLMVTQSTERVTGYKTKTLLTREPVIAKQTLETSMSVEPGKTAVIGGLIRNDGKRSFESLLLLQP